MVAHAAKRQAVVLLQATLGMVNENMIRGLLRTYGGRVAPGAKSSATLQGTVIEQLLIIQDHEGLNLRPRILPVLDLCERLQVDAQRIETELEALAAASPICRLFMAVPGIGAITPLSFSLRSKSRRASGNDHLNGRDAGCHPVTPPAVISWCAGGSCG